MTESQIFNFSLNDCQKSLAIETVQIKIEGKNLQPPCTVKVC